ncbi:MAG: SDR family NAD(P)-dependent oxidoreductase [Candidatus Synoicihabitans palmerolidicus]|nr:SDR family NAD(P)-dependent oxidoreductase [Candidatus Synoicihabitans palmerolidicus]
MFSLSAKTAYTTGAGSGIGLAIAHCFASHGAQVLILDRDPISGAAAAQSLVNAGGQAEFQALDVSDPAAWQIWPPTAHLPIFWSTTPASAMWAISSILRLPSWTHFMPSTCAEPLTSVTPWFPPCSNSGPAVLSTWPRSPASSRYANVSPTLSPNSPLSA